ncbi:hypothetical protein EK21DRAFT_115986 [Setomelanomma holmii]|uniref:Uncharacterized protein n=1 Tax=Setomelanomma holmii TaxID=210430 RepID=A0A9P4H2D2_9PLEO|nr:hypothetical protein EK21DRAFT_115986 [Setomelanomma holmii]
MATHSLTINNLAALAKKMLPPPLPHRNMSAASLVMDQQRQPMLLKDFAADFANTPLSASFDHQATWAPRVAPRAANSPHLGLKDPSHDPLLFEDPDLEHSVRAFFGLPPLIDHLVAPNPSTEDTVDDPVDYYDVKELIKPYNPAVDDLKDFKERSKLPNIEKHNTIQSESNRPDLNAQWELLRRNLGLLDDI